MAPHLLKARDAYKGQQMRTFQLDAHTHTRARTERLERDRDRVSAHPTR